MHICREDATIAVRAPAKLNLFFEVLDKRSDGYHEIETLMVPISLYDSLTFTPDDSGRITLECRWAGAKPAGPAAGAVEARGLGTLPAADENLATRAVRLLGDRAQISAGARLGLVKRIPSAAGLGGGSSDAAAALLAANIGWKLHWPLARLAELAAELGSDVPFFLYHSAAVCRGRGERIEPVGRRGQMFAVVVRPPAGLSTAAVYGHCRPGRPPHSVLPLVEALGRGDRCQVETLLHNRLEEAAGDLCPWIGRLQREFARLHCTAARMSGSGTSYLRFADMRATRGASRGGCARGVGRVYSVRL